MVAPHLEVLHLLAGFCFLVVKGIGEAHPIHGLLPDAVDGFRRGQAENIQHGGQDIVDVVELVANATPVGYSMGPVNQHRHPVAALKGALFVVFERGVARRCPACRVVGIGAGAAPVVEVIEVFLPAHLAHQ